MNHSSISNHAIGSAFVVASVASVAFMFLGCNPLGNSPLAGPTGPAPWATFTPLVKPQDYPRVGGPQATDPPAAPPAAFMPDETKPPAKLREVSADVPRRMAFTPDGKRLVAISYDEMSITVFDVATGEKIDRLETGSRPNDFAIAPDGRTIYGADVRQIIGQISLGADGKFSGRSKWDVEVGHHPGVAVSADGQFVAAVSFDKIITIFDAATGKEKARLTPPEGARSAAFSPTVPLLVVGGTGNKIMFVDLATGQATAKLIPLVSPDSDVATIAISRDGQFAATGHMDSSITIWNLATREQAHNFFVPDASCMGVAFSADGKRLITVQQNGKIHVFATATAKPLATIDAHAKPATCIAVSPTGDMMASGGEDGKIVFWR